MPCASTVMPLAKRAIERCAANYGTTCCSTWPGTWFATDLAVVNTEPLNAGQNPIRCSINRVKVSWKSPIAAAIGKDAPAIFEVLTKGHSGLTPRLANKQKFESALA